jgi:hypothetical protein
MWRRKKYLTQFYVWVRNQNLEKERKTLAAFKGLQSSLYFRDALGKFENMDLNFSCLRWKLKCNTGLKLKSSGLALACTLGSILGTLHIPFQGPHYVLGRVSSLIPLWLMWLLKHEIWLWPRVVILNYGSHYSPGHNTMWPSSLQSPLLIWLPPGPSLWFTLNCFRIIDFKSWKGG